MSSIFQAYHDYVRDNKGCKSWHEYYNLYVAKRWRRGNKQRNYKRNKDTLNRVKEETIPIVVGINGIVKFNDFLFYKEKEGNLNTNEPSFIEKNRNNPTYNPILFLFSD